MAYTEHTSTGADTETSTLSRTAETAAEQRHFVSIREAAELIGVDRCTLTRQIDEAIPAGDRGRGLRAPVLRRAEVLSLITGDTQSA